MTPKDKAKELFEKYAFVEIAYYTSKHEVKECAIIAVDEIIKSVPIAPLELSHPLFYWQEVKNEIDKL